jgi:hypothetical protein
MRIIARSRMAFWTAFETDDGAFLNVRDDAGRTVTVLLTENDAGLLAGSHETSHIHASLLARTGPFRLAPLPTPPRGNDEPEPHKWQPKQPRTERLKAA